MFPKLNLINQCDLQFLTIKWQNCTLLRILTRKKSSFISFFCQLTFGLLNPYCNSLVCLAVLILEIMPQKIASQLFSIAYQKALTHAMRRDAVAEMSWVLENTGSFIFKKFENTVYAAMLAMIFQTSCSFSVKQHVGEGGGVQFLSFRDFLLVLTKF